MHYTLVSTLTRTHIHPGVHTQVEVCCFDKTGTLTSDHLLLEEVVVGDEEQRPTAQRVMATCHALVQVCARLYVWGGRYARHGCACWLLQHAPCVRVPAGSYSIFVSSISLSVYTTAHRSPILHA